MSPGEAATIRLTGHNEQCSAYLMTFKRGDAVAYLRRQGRPLLFGQHRVDLDGQGAVIVQCIARPLLADKVVQVVLGDTMLCEGTLRLNEGLASLTLQIPLRRQLAEQALKLVIDGRTEGEIHLDPLVFHAQVLLARADEMNALVVAGKLASVKMRTAAMVLARAQLLRGIIVEPDERRHGEFIQRANTVKDALAALEGAFADYASSTDPYRKKHGLFLSAYLSRADASAQIYGLYVPANYNASKAYPLLVALHGSGGSFLSGEASNPPDGSPYFFARVDGRGSGGGYQGLSELDVLEVIADVAGGVNYMYTSGEPLLIVKGTAGADQSLLAAIDRASRELSTSINGRGTKTLLGGIPIIADSALTDAEIREKNLIIIGPATANRYLAHLIDRLPVQEEGTLRLGNERYPLAGCGYALFYVNPEAPARFILVLSAPEVVKFPTAINRLFAPMLSAGPLGLYLLDLTENSTIRWIAWEKNWQAPATAFAEERLPAAFRSVGDYARYENAAIIKATGADMMFVQPGNPEAMLYDIRHARWSDYRSMKDKPTEMYTSLLNGAEITEIMQALPQQGRRIMLWPEDASDKLLPERTYRICFQPNLASTLRQHQKNLPNISLIYVNPYAEVRKSVQ